MNILICDDDIEFIKKIKYDITKNMDSIDIEYHIFTKNNDFLSISTNIYDVIFMDIDLIEIDGINIAKKLKKLMPNVLVIFVSSHNDLVFNTLSIGIFEFIRKDNYQDDFEKCIKELITYLKKYRQFVVLSIKGRKTKILIKDIKYILSIGHEITIHCYNHEISFRGTMAEVLAIIHSKNIVQIQRGMSINLDYINEVKKWEIIGDDGYFQIGRKYQKSFLESYEDYLLR